jgi:hypothetical protein
MRRLIVLAILLITARGASSQSFQQCQSAASDVMKIKSDSDFTSFVATMTAGDLMSLSTSLARCVEAHAAELTTTQVDKLHRVIYKLDAETSSRLWNFIQRNNLDDKFNDEEQARMEKAVGENKSR